MERDEAEELLARQLGEEPAETDEEEAGAKAAKRLHPKWEIRIPANVDPIVEETIAYRHLAREVDGRYDGVKTEGVRADSAAKSGGIRADSASADRINSDSAAKSNSAETDGSKRVSREEEHSE
ncbi:hypothetical protein [Cohnella cellulosilytica]|uniref:Uncharacterized protein n=1 Tax=Cohnella cellulosilytica TaxID=986710 RepID=A0ABW2FHV3_9BACL